MSDTDWSQLKLRITQAIISQIPNPYNDYLQLPTDKVIPKFWMTGRNGGMRLTDEGAKAFGYADIEYFSFSLKSKKLNWYPFLLEINKKIKCPYFLGSKDKVAIIQIYDSKIAMVIELYGGIYNYLESIKL